MEICKECNASTGMRCPKHPIISKPIDKEVPLDRKSVPRQGIETLKGCGKIMDGCFFDEKPIKCGFKIKGTVQLCPACSKEKNGNK